MDLRNFLRRSCETKEVKIMTQQEDHVEKRQARVARALDTHLKRLRTEGLCLLILFCFVELTVHQLACGKLDGLKSFRETD